MMGWYGNGMGTGMLLGTGVFWLILLGLIVWLVLRLLPGSGGGSVPATGESALEILDRRMASGKLDAQTWQTQRAAPRKQTAPAFTVRKVERRTPTGFR